MAVARISIRGLQRLAILYRLPAEREKLCAPAERQNGYIMIAPTSNLTQWYVLYVKPRHEKCVFTMVRNKGYEGLLPLYAKRTRSRTSELPLFPGYVFCRFDPADRLAILTVPGVFSIVGFAGNPIPVAEAEIDALQRVILNGLPREPWPTLTSGAPVSISRGPMQGVQGVVLKYKNITRVVISVALLQRSIAVEVDRDWLDDESMTVRAAA